MTKKDYILIANVLANTYETSKNNAERDTVIAIISQLVDKLKADNANFNADTFRKACIK